MDTDNKGAMRVTPQPEFDGYKYFVPKDQIPAKAAFIGGLRCVTGGWGFAGWIGARGNLILPHTHTHMYTIDLPICIHQQTHTPHSTQNIN